MNPRTPPTPEELVFILKLICNEDTSTDPDGWSPANPFWGHSEPAALIVQDFFGGKILRAHLRDAFPEFARLGTHAWNRLPDGRELDVTGEQFCQDVKPRLDSEIQNRNYLLSIEEYGRHYRLLRARLDKILKGEAPFAPTNNPQRR